MSKLGQLALTQFLKRNSKSFKLQFPHSSRDIIEIVIHIFIFNLIYFLQGKANSYFPHHPPPPQWRLAPPWWRQPANSSSSGQQSGSQGFGSVPLLCQQGAEDAGQGDHSVESVVRSSQLQKKRLKKRWEAAIKRPGCPSGCSACSFIQQAPV